MESTFQDSQIVEFYSEKTIFITGTTGFLGKIILALLIKNCPKIKKIFCLIRRGKGNISGQDRLDQEVLSLEIFSDMMKKDSSFKRKIFVWKKMKIYSG